MLRFRLYPTIHQTKGWNFNTVWLAVPAVVSLSYNPSNQGLKQFIHAYAYWIRINVFILQSIKPRVETCLRWHRFEKRHGLYPTIHQTKGWNLFLPWPCLCHLRGLYPTIHQTKGWNLKTKKGAGFCTRSLSYNPSNQGLKQRSPVQQQGLAGVFILQSIKPRVETLFLLLGLWTLLGLYPTIHQTKGWNFISVSIWGYESSVFILQSIKPRVETISGGMNHLAVLGSLSYNPSNQGLKQYKKEQSWLT